MSKPVTAEELERLVGKLDKGRWNDDDWRAYTDASRRIAELEARLEDLIRIADEYRERIAVLEKTLTHSTSCLVSLRKNYEDDIPLWSDVSHAITEGNTALAREQEEGNDLPPLSQVR